MKKVVYIIGPYRGETSYRTLHNIIDTFKWVDWCWEHDFIPVCTHMSAAFTNKVISDKAVLEGYIEIMSRCDAVLLTGDWESSEGAIQEHTAARELGLPVLDPKPV